MAQGVGSDVCVLDYTLQKLPNSERKVRGKGENSSITTITIIREIIKIYFTK